MITLKEMLERLKGFSATLEIEIQDGVVNKIHIDGSPMTSVPALAVLITTIIEAVDGDIEEYLELIADATRDLHMMNQFSQEISDLFDI